MWMGCNSQMIWSDMCAISNYMGVIQVVWTWYGIWIVSGMKREKCVICRGMRMAWIWCVSCKYDIVWYECDVISKLCDAIWVWYRCDMVLLFHNIYTHITLYDVHAARGTPISWYITHISLSYHLAITSHSHHTISRLHHIISHLDHSTSRLNNLPPPKKKKKKMFQKRFSCGSSRPGKFNMVPNKLFVLCLP